jgi:peptide/nickel transport system substrate-binding protein
MLGLNRQWMVDKLLGGQGIVANSPILPGTWAYYDGVAQIGFDPDAAAAAMKSAGYVLPATGNVRSKGSVALSFTLAYPDDTLHGQLAKNIQQDWAAIGVDVTLKAVSYDSLINDYLTPRTYQAVLADLDLTRSYDPDPYPFWHQAEITGGQNYSQWDNGTASEYLEQARITADPGVRLRLYRNFQVVFASELPALLLYYPVYTFAIDQRVQGVQGLPLFEPADRFDGISSWYLVTKRALDQTTQPTIQVGLATPTGP